MTDIFPIRLSAYGEAGERLIDAFVAQETGRMEMHVFAHRTIIDKGRTAVEAILHIPFRNKEQIRIDWNIFIAEQAERNPALEREAQPEMESYFTF